jgi:MoxR-like ATPase
VLDLPSERRELAIVRRRVPGASEALAAALVRFVQSVRTAPLRKMPSVSETLDWARSLVLLGASSLDPALVRETLGVLLKHREDVAQIEPKLHEHLSFRRG